MPELTYTTQDKSTWGDGPWQDEPDKVQWRDVSTGLPCLVVRNHHGAWCGYVGVPRGHPWYGASYEQPDVDVHGGLTYSAPCVEGEDEAVSICHVPEPGEPDDVFWLGFDCGHAFDLSPGMFARLVAQGWDDDYVSLKRHCVYRTIEFVRGEVGRLAKQVAERA